MVHGLMAIDGHKSAVGVFTGILQDGQRERTAVAQRLSRSLSASTSDLYFGDFVKVSRIQGRSEVALDSMHWPPTMPGLKLRLHEKTCS